MKRGFMPSITLLTSIALSGALVAAEQDPTPPTRDPAKTYEQPTTPLDSRINPDKITETNPPPLPEQVILPMPPDHRIAARPEDVPIDPARWEQARAAIARGLDFLRSTQHPSGAWMRSASAAPTDQPDKPSPVAVAITALAVRAFAQNGASIESDPAFARGIQFVLDAQDDLGSFGAGSMDNYVTSAVVSGLAAVDEPTVEQQLVMARRYLEGLQWDQAEGVSPRQDWFGGAGYGRNGRPDLSNTQMMLEAFYDAGLSPDDPVFQKALAFLQRAQNLKAVNPNEWAADDGGFVYTPANGGESFASEDAGEGRYGEIVPDGAARSLRSYGSMTYAGFKSLLYAGLSPDDLRVRAAFDWIRTHFTFDENPGLGQQGLYYYYHAMARALRVAQQDVITDEDGSARHWRTEMVDAILSRQRDEGSWINDADRWMEGDPELVTIYAILALQEAIKRG
jgi:squalene-hopene/tetraprenyl-beta-curcumene cyclase